MTTAGSSNRDFSAAKIRWGLLALVICLLVAGAWLWLRGGSERGMEPLYWVAPMDPNYRREGPGKSPMGMDLIPVYADDARAGDTEPGVVAVSPEVQQQMGVRAQAVVTGSLRPLLRTHGRVLFDQTLIAKLSPRVTGWVDALFVSTEGEPVRRGQPLYALYSPELIQAQQAFLDAVSGGDEADVQWAESKLKAYKLDEVAIGQLRDERVVQESVVYRAPKDGMVGMLTIAEGNYVEPGDMLMAIGTLERVWAEFNVFASQASLIKPRQLITMTTPSHPGLVWDGEIDYIFHALDKDTHSLRFRAVIDNPGMRLKPNMFIKGSVVLPERDAALLVPYQSVIRLGDQDRVVLALGEGRFKSVRVTMGETDGRQIEILEGLEEGDRVVTSAHFLIDSESSKSSDFRRMEAPDAAAPKYPPTWVEASILAVDPVQRTLTLQHEEIIDWAMPGMIMDFQATDDFDLKGLQDGERVEVKIVHGAPLFQVTDIKKLEAEEAP